MYALDLCRICFSAPGAKDVRDLKICENEHNSENYVQILLFCLDIVVMENSAISTKLCGKCYEAIISYHRFKTLALKNDRYLKTIKPFSVKLEQMIKDEPESEPEIADTYIEIEIEKLEVEDEFDYSKFDDVDLLTTVVNPKDVLTEQRPISENEISARGPRRDEEVEPNSNTLENQSTETEHPVSESCIAVQEAPSTSNNDFTDKKLASTSSAHFSPLLGIGLSQGTQLRRVFVKKPSEEDHTTLHGPYTEELMVKSNMSFDETALNTQDYNINIEAANEHGSDICNYTTNDASILQVHNIKSHSASRPHTGEKLYACEICDKKFTRKSYLKIHIRIHTGEKPYACEVCDKKFTNKCHLVAHIRIHIGEKPYACEVCNKKFIHTNDLKKLYACEICDKNFTRKSYLNTHIRIHTGEKPYGCDVCDKKFIHTNELKKHIRTHTGEKPYGCNICNKKFTVRSSLKDHIRIHTGEKPYACDVCDKKFTNKCHLVAHIRIHTGEKPYACEVCDKKFTQRFSLKQHITIHTGEKLYACDVCDKKFTQKSYLQKHIRIHTGKKVYACETCDKKFIQKSYLQKHIRIHTGKKLYACETCDKKFTLKSTLRRHTIRIHT